MKKSFFERITRPRALGVLIFTGVPAIIGGGLIWWATGHSYKLVVPYEIVLYLISMSIAAKAPDLEH